MSIFDIFKFKKSPVKVESQASATFFNTVRKKVFGGPLTQKQVDGINIILKATRGLAIEYRAYLLATAYHETAATMEPVRETKAESDTKAVAILDNAFRKGQLTWVKNPYWHFDSSGKTWLGRGYVQITHKDNYIKASKKLNVDLLSNPNKALDPAVAAQVLVRGCMEGWFTGKSLTDYDNYRDMRRVVNGTDRASLVAAYADSFEEALRNEENV